MVLVNFWRYPDPYQRFLIRIRPNDTDPKRCSFKNLMSELMKKRKVIKVGPTDQLCS